MIELKTGVVLKCKQNLYKSTYKKFAFIQGKEYTLSSVDEKFAYFIDEEKHDFNFFRDNHSIEDGFGFYQLTAYFEMDTEIKKTDLPVTRSEKQGYINKNFNFLGKLCVYLGMIRVRFHKHDNGRIRGDEKIVIWNPLVIITILISSIAVMFIAFYKFWASLNHELRIRQREN